MQSSTHKIDFCKHDGEIEHHICYDMFNDRHVPDKYRIKICPRCHETIHREQGKRQPHDATIRSPTEQIRVSLEVAGRLREMISGKKHLMTIGDVVQYLLEYYDKTSPKEDDEEETSEIDNYRGDNNGSEA